MNVSMKYIDNLNVSDEAKEVLKKTHLVANNSNPYVKQSIKSLFITSPQDKILSEYGKTYERIIIENHVYNLIGKNTYLELAFPKYGSEKDYFYFFDSITVAAATTNIFQGVFLISFEQFSSYYELTKEKDNFIQLINFINKNKNNISYIFHVLPSFQDRNRLLKELNTIVNIIPLDLINTNLNDSVGYLRTKIGDSDIVLSSENKDKIEKYIEKKINENFDSNDYLSHEILEKFANEILFELSSCDNKIEIKKEDIDRIITSFDFSLKKNNDSSRKLGFTM